MRDPFSWSIPMGRLFGTNIRAHIIFPLFILAMWLRAAAGKDWPVGSANAMLVFLGLLFLAVLLHEFGHCFAARSVEGDAEDILLWPLGGLAKCDIPHNPWAHFVTAAGGPTVNLVLAVVCCAVLLVCQIVPPYLPWPQESWVMRLQSFDGQSYFNPLFAMNQDQEFQLQVWQVLVAQFFWINYFLFLLNVLVIGFPLDGGRMLQAILWPRMGYQEAMRTAIFVGFVAMFVVGLAGLVLNEVMYLALAVFIYVSCRQEWLIITSHNEDSLFGYDFSQGYTSLEQDLETQNKPARRQPNFFQRWLQQRAQRKMQKEMQRAAEEEQRMDELLDKIQRLGRDSLTDDETRFLKRVSDRYRNRP